MSLTTNFEIGSEIGTRDGEGRDAPPGLENAQGLVVTTDVRPLVGDIIVAPSIPSGLASSPGNAVDHPSTTEVSEQAGISLPPDYPRMPGDAGSLTISSGSFDAVNAAVQDAVASI